MMGRRPPAQVARQQAVHRLDRLGNPAGPSLRVFEELAREDALLRPATLLEREIVERLSDAEAIPTSWLVVGAGADDLIGQALRAFASPTNLVHFPPTDLAQTRMAERLGLTPLPITRSSRMGVDLDRPGLPGFPPNAVSLVQTPNDPTGTITTPQDVVRMARRSRLVLVDERHAGHDRRSLLPLVREFDNVVILRSLEIWAGLAAFPVAFAIGSPRIMATLRDARLTGPGTANLVAAHATLDDLRHVRRVADQLRDEKDRLYRTLRKMNMLTPYPSWASFVMVRLERGDPATVLDELVERGIVLHRTPQPELDAHARISAVSHDATAALRAALIDLAADL